MKTALDAVPITARRQAGVFTADQAIAHGWSSRQVQRRVSSGRWLIVAGRGLTASPKPDSWWQRAWAAWLTYPDAVLGRRVAALAHDFPVQPEPIVESIDLFCRAGRRGTQAIRPHSPAVPPDQVLWLGGLPFTDRDRTAVDCLATFGWDESLDLYAWLSSRQLITHADLTGAARDRLGRPGTPQLLRLVRFTRDGAVSAGEYRLHQLLRRAGITGWQAAAEVWDSAGRIGVVDLLFDSARVVVEIDGLDAHSGKLAFVRDRQRQNRLINAGYRVLRFTWWDLVERPDEVLAMLRHALAA